MKMILILIILSYFAMVFGKYNWKSEAVKYTIIVVISLLQTLYILYEILNMSPPWVK
jgi:hypothetical protein